MTATSDFTTGHDTKCRSALDMHPQTQELLTYLDDCRKRLRDAVEAVPEGDRARHPGAGRWSVAEILTHLGIVEKRVAILVKRMTDGVRRGEPAPPVAFEPSAAIAGLEERGALDRSRKIVAPEAARPNEDADLDAAWKALAASRAAMRDAVLAGDGLPLAGAVVPHPIFGPLNTYEWIAFVGGHDLRHADQIRETAEALRTTP
jgi:hypothetical protein